MPNVTDVRLPFLLECYELVPSSKDQLPVDERLHIFTILVYLVKFHKIADHQLLLKATMHWMRTKKKSTCNLICSLIRIDPNWTCTNFLHLSSYIFIFNFQFYIFFIHVHVSSFVIGFSWLLVDILSLDIGSTIDVRLSKLLHIGQNQRQVKAKPSTLDFLLKKQSLDVPNANKVTWQEHATISLRRERFVLVFLL